MRKLGSECWYASGDMVGRVRVESYTRSIHSGTTYRVRLLSDISLDEDWVWWETGSTANVTPRSLYTELPKRYQHLLKWTSEGDGSG